MSKNSVIEMEINEQPQVVQDFYYNLVSKGETPQMSHMLAMRQSPRMLGGDQYFCEGNRRKMMDMDESSRDELVRVAKKNGINTGGKYHHSGIGAASDPGSWVSSSDDLLDVCKKRGLSCEGAVTYKAPEQEYKVEDGTKNRESRNKAEDAPKG